MAKTLNPDTMLATMKAGIQPKMDAADQLTAALKEMTAQKDDAARRRAELEAELARVQHGKDAAYKSAWTKATQAGWLPSELRGVGFPNPTAAPRKPRQAPAPVPPPTPTQPNHAAINPDPAPTINAPENNTWT